MAKFPRNESKVKALAQNIVTGLTANAALYPAPPVSPAALQATLDSLTALTSDVVAARAAAERATLAKDAELNELKIAMKSVLRYCENTVKHSDPELSLLGWGGRSENVSLTAPGQVQTLTITSQGETSLTLEWKKPMDGGTVATYKLEARERPNGAWGIISIAMESQAELTNQERGKDWEYRVIAINKAGEGIPSNTVAAVL
jgi:hypothetical protein